MHQGLERMKFRDDVAVEHYFYFSTFRWSVLVKSSRLKNISLYAILGGQQVDFLSLKDHDLLFERHHTCSPSFCNAVLKKRKMGRLDVRVCAAKNLPDTQLVGTPDPYCVLKLEGQTHRTKVVSNTVNPVWDEIFKLAVADENSSQLIVEVWNSNLMSDEFLGVYQLSLTGLVQNLVRDQWFLLKQCKKNAELHLRVMAVDFGLPNVAAAPSQPASAAPVQQILPVQQFAAPPPQHANQHHHHHHHHAHEQLAPPAGYQPTPSGPMHHPEMLHHHHHHQQQPFAPAATFEQHYQSLAPLGAFVAPHPNAVPLIPVVVQPPAIIPFPQSNAPWTAYNMGEEEFSHLVSVFIFFDQDDSNQLNKQEATRLLRYLNYARTQEEVGTVFAMMDRDRSGSITKDELLTWMRYNAPDSMALYGMSRMDYHQFLFQFHQHDKDLDGILREHEFVALLVEKLGVPTARAKDIFSKADVDRSGGVDIHEYLVFRRYAASHHAH